MSQLTRKFCKTFNERGDDAECGMAIECNLIADKFLNAINEHLWSTFWMGQLLITAFVGIVGIEEWLEF